MITRQAPARASDSIGRTDSNPPEPLMNGTGTLGQGNWTRYVPAGPARPIGVPEIRSTSCSRAMTPAAPFSPALYVAESQNALSSANFH